MGRDGEGNREVVDFQMTKRVDVIELVFNRR